VKKLLVDGFTTKIACPTGSYRVCRRRVNTDPGVASEF